MKNKLKPAIKACQQAHKDLATSLQVLKDQGHKEPIKSVLHDACIKRFEVLFEYVWKALKLAAEYEGREAPGPRIAIQEGIRFGWVKDPDFWAMALEARNGSVHDYFGISHEEYLKLIEKFVGAVSTLLKKLGEL